MGLACLDVSKVWHAICVGVVLVAGGWAILLGVYVTFVWRWCLLQGGEHRKPAFASYSPSSPRVDLVSPHDKSRTWIWELEILSPHSVHLHCQLKVMLDHVCLLQEKCICCLNFGILIQVLKNYALLWWFIDLCLYLCMNACCRAERRQEQILPAP
jgi:hypothetical protein